MASTHARSRLGQQTPRQNPPLEANRNVTSRRAVERKENKGFWTFSLEEPQIAGQNSAGKVSLNPFGLTTDSPGVPSRHLRSSLSICDHHRSQHRSNRSSDFYCLQLGYRQLQISSITILHTVEGEWVFRGSELENGVLEETNGQQEHDAAELLCKYSHNRVGAHLLARRGMRLVLVCFALTAASIM